MTGTPCNRRQFLERASLAPLAPLAPTVPAFLSRMVRGAEDNHDSRILVVIQLSGG